MFGEDHPDFAQNIYNLGNLFLRQSKTLPQYFQKAEEHYKKALIISRRNFSLDHILSLKISIKFLELKEGVKEWKAHILQKFKGAASNVVAVKQHTQGNTLTLQQAPIDEASTDLTEKEVMESSDEDDEVMESSDEEMGFSMLL